MSREDALAVLRSEDLELLDVLAAAYRIRHRYFGNVVKLNFLVNAKSGHCPEDCGYCSQSRFAKTTEIERYKLNSREEILEKAEACVASGATTCCLVISGRGPTEKEMQRVEEAVREVKASYPALKVCACLGLLTPEQAVRLKDAGVERLNHNLNTSQGFYDKVCTTHTYEDRVATLEAAKHAGLSLCSGGIAGMGESDEQLVEMAFALAALPVDSIPVNFLHAVPGTAMEHLTDTLTPRQCLRILCMFRFTNPTREVRVSGGRELHLRTLQPMSLYPANAIFAADYLTTEGQSVAQDVAMIEELGFTVERVDPVDGDVPSSETAPPPVAAR